MTILSDEIATGPLAAELAGFVTSGLDGMVAEVLNRKDIPVNGTLSWSDFSAWAAATGVRADIDDWKISANRSVRAIALTLLDGLQRGEGSIDFSLQSIQGMLNALVAFNLLSTDDKTSLLAAGSKLISRAEQLGITVTIQDVAQALRG